MMCTCVADSTSRPCRQDEAARIPSKEGLSLRQATIPSRPMSSLRRSIAAEDAAAALGELLAVGFINVEQEVQEERTELVVDPGEREDELREILTKHRGVEIKLPG